jgi:transcription antitermination factor NusG
MVLSHGERVAVIPEQEIDAIRRTVEGPFRAEPHPFLKCGDRVRVIRGSLHGIEGILVRKKNQFRLVLSVDMLAKSVAVEIDVTDVEPVTPGVQRTQLEHAGDFYGKFLHAPMPAPGTPPITARAR